MGCAPVVAFAVAHPETVASMILYWPVGGAKYRIGSHQRFAEHIAFARENGLDRVVTLVRAKGKPFDADPRGGPWASVIKNDAAFAAAYPRQDLQRYIAICGAMRDALFDRDTAPGAEPEQLMSVAIPAFIVPGHDAAHATSAARYLEECLPQSRYWDVAVEAQTEDATNPHVLEFLRAVKLPAKAADLVRGKMSLRRVRALKLGRQGPDRRALDARALRHRARSGAVVVRRRNRITLSLPLASVSAVAFAIARLKCDNSKGLRSTANSSSAAVALLL